MLFSRFSLNMQEEKIERKVTVYYQEDTGSKLKLCIDYVVMVNPNYWILLPIGSARYPSNLLDGNPN